MPRADEAVLTLTIDGKEIFKSVCAWSAGGQHSGTDPELIASVAATVLGRDTAQQMDITSRVARYEGVKELLGY